MMHHPHAPATLLVLAALALPVSAGETMYATSSSVNPNLLTIDSATGAMLTSVTITNDEALFGGLTFASDGMALYSIDGYNDGVSDRTFRIDPVTGVGAVVGDTGFNWNFRCVDTDPISGTLFAMRDSELFTLDTTTGAATSVGSMGGASTLDQATALAIDRSGNAYVTDIGNVGLFSLDLSTGALTHLGDLTSPTYFRDLAFDSSGTLWGVGMNGGGLYNIDTVAVTATLIHTSPTYGGIAFAPGDGPGTGYCFGDPGSGTPCPCVNDNDGSVPGSGCANGVYASGAKLTGSGVASVSADTLVLQTSGLEPSNAGLYFQADNDLSPGLIWGDGLQCAGGSLKRLGVRFADGTGYSDTSGYGYTISSKAGNVSAGDTKRYQCWYRNIVNPPCGLGVNDFNASNGYEIIWLP